MRSSSRPRPASLCALPARAGIQPAGTGAKADSAAEESAASADHTSDREKAHRRGTIAPRRRLPGSDLVDAAAAARDGHGEARVVALERVPTSPYESIAPPESVPKARKVELLRVAGRVLAVPVRSSGRRGGASPPSARLRPSVRPGLQLVRLIFEKRLNLG